MRSAFIRTLHELAREDDRIFLITGDLGFGVVTDFADELPSQFLNVGVAEQNMTGIAAGMALSGYIVFTYSIGNFPTIRCLEQVRNDVCYHRANVKIVSIGAGFSYGPLGSTHHATEDLAVMRALPNLVVMAPGDPVEAARAVREVAAYEGPCYLRLGRAGDRTVHGSDELDLRIGRAITLQDGDDLTLLVTGSLLPNAMDAAARLKERGISTRVLSMHTIKPLDMDAVRRAADETSAIVTLEEHSVIGGLGSAVAEALMEGRNHSVRFRRLGIADRFAARVGDQDHLRTQAGLDAASIAAECESLLRAPA